MAKISQKSHKNSSNTTTTTNATKVKRTRKSVPRDSPPQRSSIYRGVTRSVINFTQFTWNGIILSLSLSLSLTPLFLSLDFGVFWWLCVFSGTDGRAGTRPICGTRTAGMRLRTRKEDKVLLFFYFVFAFYLFIYFIIIIIIWNYSNTLYMWLKHLSKSNFENINIRVFE